MIQGNGKQRAKQGQPGAGWVFRPLDTLPASVRWMYVGSLTCLAGVLSFFLQRRMESPFGIPDHEYYVLMAQRQGALVPQPFASRPLAPLLAHGIATLTNRPVEQGFALLGWVSLLGTMVVVFALAMRSAAPRWLPLLLALTPFWPELLHALALPDLLSAALLCGLLLCLEADRPLWAALTLCPLMLGRESTTLVLVCLLLVSWRRLRWLGCVVAVGAVAVGSLIVRAISSGAAGNTEHLPTTLYLAAKVPWNLVRLAGIAPWSNLYPYLCTVPALQVAVHLGPLRSLGVCSVSPLPAQTAGLALLTSFGLLPALCVLLWRGLRSERGLDLLTRFCLLYGGFSCVLAPLIGTAYSRLFGYAWPMFLVALPRLFPMVAAQAGEDVQTVGRRPGEWPQAGHSGFWEGFALGALLVVHLAFGAFAFVNASPALLIWAGALEIAGVLLLVSARSGLLRAARRA